MKIKNYCIFDAVTLQKAPTEGEFLCMKACCFSFGYLSCIFSCFHYYGVTVYLVIYFIILFSIFIYLLFLINLMLIWNFLCALKFWIYIRVIFFSLFHYNNLNQNIYKYNNMNDIFSFLLFISLINLLIIYLPHIRWVQNLNFWFLFKSILKMNYLGTFILIHSPSLRTMSVFKGIL